jgi:hypothetical protein
MYYIRGEIEMTRMIHARMDAETETLVKDLGRRLGWNDSRIVREGIKALAVLMVPAREREIIGLGQFESGIADLGSNKQHLKGFGS